MTEKIKLSPSKLKTWDTCSYLFALRYSKLINDGTFPNSSNSGASRGSVCHYVLECLANAKKKNRRDYVSKIASSSDPFVVPSVKRMILHHAKNLGVDSSDNIQMIRDFIVTATVNDLFCDGSLELLLEKSFKYEGKNFLLNGIIDQLAVYPDRVLVRDFKGSKSKFSKEELAFNYQNLIYTFAVKKEYPNLPVSLVFEFLKFKRSPMQPAPEVSDKEFEGLESYLENMAEFLTDFNEAKAKSNFAKNSDKNRFLCGKLPGEMNAAGTAPAFVCPAKFPRTYFVLKDADGKFIKSDFEKKALDKHKKEGYTIETQFYEGCSAWKFLWKE